MAWNCSRLSDRLILFTLHLRDGRPLFNIEDYAHRAIASFSHAQEEYPFELLGYAILPDRCSFIATVPAPGSILTALRVYRRNLESLIGVERLLEVDYDMQIMKNLRWAQKRLRRTPIDEGICAEDEDYPWLWCARGGETRIPMTYVER